MKKSSILFFGILILSSIFICKAESNEEKIVIVEPNPDYISNLRIQVDSSPIEYGVFELTDDGIRQKLPEILPLVEKEDQLVALLSRRGFDTARGHYEQAVAAHTRGEWASANAQLRTFVEEFFDNVHAIVCGGTNESSNQKRIALAQAGFFVSDYNEFLSNGTGFVEGFWKRLHPQGSHPGLSEQSDCTFRLHLVILVLHYFLTRLDETH